MLDRWRIWHALHDALALADWIDRRSCYRCCNALALFHVENGVVAKHDRPALYRIAVCVFDLSRADLPEDYFGAMLSLANVASAVASLLANSKGEFGWREGE